MSEEQEKVFGAEGAETNEGGENATAKAGAESNQENENNEGLTGIDLYLKDYGLDEAIPIEDEEKKFNELSAEEQYNILKSFTFF